MALGSGPRGDLRPAQGMEVGHEGAEGPAKCRADEGGERVEQRDRHTPSIRATYELRLPNQPRRSIHFASSRTGDTVKAAVATMSQSATGNGNVPNGSLRTGR